MLTFGQITHFETFGFLVLKHLFTQEEATIMKCEAEDESAAKDQVIQTFVNVCRTYPFELRMVVHAGTSQIIRRKKIFEP